VPCEHVNVCPVHAFPVIAGGELLTGAVGAAVGVIVFESALPVPAAFVAATVHLTACPSSATCSTYVLDVAPAIGVPLRFHW
jgi:hypothetical protein